MSAIATKTASTVTSNKKAAVKAPTAKRVVVSAAQIAKEDKATNARVRENNTAAALAKALDSAAMVEIELAGGEKIFVPAKTNVSELNEIVKNSHARISQADKLRLAEKAAEITRNDFNAKKESSTTAKLVGAIAALGLVVIGWRVYKDGAAQVGSDILDGAQAGAIGFGAVGGVVGMAAGGVEGFVKSEGKSATKRFGQTVGSALGGSMIGAAGYGTIGAVAGGVSGGLFGNVRDYEVGGVALQDIGGIALENTGGVALG